VRNKNQRKNIDDSMDLRAAQYVRIGYRRRPSARGPTMMARIGTLRALNRHVERVFDSSRRRCIGDNVS
jgi:hypothetical protein